MSTEKKEGMDHLVGIPVGIPIEDMRGQTIRVLHRHFILLNTDDGKCLVVKTFVPLYGERRTEVYYGVVRRDAEGNIIAVQKICAQKGYEFPPATLDSKVFHAEKLDEVLREVRAKEKASAS